MNAEESDKFALVAQINTLLARFHWEMQKDENLGYVWHIYNDGVHHPHIYIKSSAPSSAPRTIPDLREMPLYENEG